MAPILQTLCETGAHHAQCGVNTYSCNTQLYASLWKYLSSYRKLVDLHVWILFMWYQKQKVSRMMVLGMTEFLNLQQRC